MKFSQTKLSIAAAIVALLLALMSSYIRSIASAKSEPSPNPKPVATSLLRVAPQTDSNLTFVRVTLFPYGFEPEVLTVHASPFFLTIEDRAGTDDFAFEILSEQNEPVFQTAIPSGDSSSYRELTLAPGKYLLKETLHWRWACTINVLSN